MRTLSLTLLLACGCAGGASRPQRTTPTGGERSADAEALPTAAMSARPTARELAPEASYGELMRLARALLRTGGGDSNAGCVLTRSGASFLFSADLMPALQTPPDPSAPLAPLLGDHLTSVRVLTAWGSLGSGNGVALAALTATPPASARQPLTALVLTSEGVFLRHGERDASPTRDGPLPSAAVAERLAALEAETASGPRALYVAAESTVAVSDLAALLGALPAKRAVALAVVLPPGTELPNATPPTAVAVRSCPEGLPPVGTDEALGDMAVGAAMGGIAPLHDAARRCMSLARAGGAAGGKLALALRIGSDGHVRERCLMADGVGDAVVTACVLGAAGGLTFPPPSPAGVVDLQLPLTLVPAEQAPTRALCE